MNRKFLSRLGLEPFVIFLFITIALAWIFPGPGSRSGLFSLNTVAFYAISVIFFFYGLRLDWTQIREDLSNKKLHLLVLFSTFLFFPLLILLTMQILGTTPTREQIQQLETSSLTGPEGGRLLVSGLWLGIFFLATLPSTVSSSVVMVNIARGNIPGAIFNASLSSLLGVILTPLWMRIFIDSDTGGAAWTNVLISLTLQVIFPIGLGIFLHRWWGSFAVKHNRLLKYFDEASILLIVYTSFCHSFAEKMFSGISARQLFLLALGLAGLFFLVYGTILFLTNLFHFSKGDQITALFCGSKKSLVHGTVMSRIILSNPKLAGILILPTMIFHALQLMFVGIIAHSLSRRNETSAPKDSHDLEG